MINSGQFFASVTVCDKDVRIALFPTEIDALNDRNESLSNYTSDKRLMVLPITPYVYIDDRLIGAKISTIETLSIPQPEIDVEHIKQMLNDNQFYRSRKPYSEFCKTQSEENALSEEQIADFSREKLKPEVVTNQELIDAFASTKYFKVDMRKFVANALLDCAQGNMFPTDLAKCLISLELVEAGPYDCYITKKGIQYLFDFHKENGNDLNPDSLNTQFAQF